MDKINNGRDECPFNIEVIEKKYNATYVGEFCLKGKDGDWVNAPASVFYQPKKPQEDYSHYFALIMQNGQVLITSGESAVQETIWAVKADDGEILYSRYRHDYRTSRDGSVTIDGGRDYTRTYTSDLIALKIVDGKFTQPQATHNIKAKL